MTKMDDFILVGVISAAHGIKGHNIVKSYTSEKENLLKYKLYSNNSGALESIELKFIRDSKNNELICQINGAPSRNEAENYKGIKLFCAKSDLPELHEEDSYYIYELINLPILDNQQNQIGIVENVANYGAGDIICMRTNEDEEYLLPFSKEFFPIVTKEHLVCEDAMYAEYKKA
jgi:16S rRNA processing protein RimM